METEFNPTKKDLLLIDGLILDIRSKKNQLVNRKISLQSSLTQLKEKYQHVPFNDKDFKRIKSTRQNIIEHVNGIELKIKNLNQELIFKNKLRLEIEHHLKHCNISDNVDMAKVMNKLLILKTKYSDFTKDKTRIASLRVMAAEFITELENIIKSI